MQEIVQEKYEWTDKYRPKSLRRMVGNKPIIMQGEQMAINRNFPNLLLIGQSGVGKTTFVYALLHDIGGTPNILELNASDERGINTVRYDIKSFAESRPIIGTTSFNVVILDEADSMLKDTQEALRRQMETFSKNCRYVFIGNDPYGFIDAIYSRCRVFYFKPIKDSEAMEYMRRIVTKEGIKISSYALRRIARDSDGDLRLAINTLQTICEGKDSIKDSEVKYLIGTDPFGRIGTLLNMALAGKFTDAFTKLEQITYFTSPRSIADYLRDCVSGENELALDEVQVTSIAKTLDILSKNPTFDTFCSFLVNLYLNYLELKKVMRRR